MSECIPLEIQEEILRRIPDVKSLIRFKSVSKTWKSLIDSSQFIIDHTQRKQHHHHHHNHNHVYLRYSTDDESVETHHVSILDNDSFPQHKVPLTIPNPYYPCLVGTSSHGLFCFRNDYDSVAVVWNPSIRKSVTVDLPNMLAWPYNTVIGFGVCPHTLHFKLIKVSYISNWDALKNISFIPCQVEVFTRGAWRRPLCINNLPRRTIRFESDQVVVIDGFIYWHAFYMIPDNGTNSWNIWDSLIISFDLTSEEFAEIYLPNGLALAHSKELYISKLKESLVMLQHKSVSNELVFDVWKMEHDVSKTFSKLYTISTPELSGVMVHGFRKSGEPIISSIDYADDDCYDPDNQARTFYVYEPDSRNIKDLGIPTQISYKIRWSSYVETLLLLDY